MSWVRCLRCRSVGDRENSAVCLGCGAPFHKAPGRSRPELQRETKRDLSFANIFTLFLAFLAVAGLIAIAVDPKGGASVGLALIDFPIIVILLIVVIGRGIVKLKAGALASAFLALAGLAAAFFGAFLLVALACSAAL